MMLPAKSLKNLNQKPKKAREIAEKATYLYFFTYLLIF